MSENRPAGPSGKPVLHVIHCNSMKEAKEQAQRAGQGPPEKHQAHEPGQLPHFHPTNIDGTIKKNGQHFTFPK